LNDNLETV